jgi:ribosomal protein S20
MNKVFYVMASFLLLALPLYTQAQQTLSDTTAVALATSRHTSATDARLLSGTEYLDYTPGNTIGNQFYVSNIAQLGTVYYDGRYFKKVPLLYDLKLDQLILSDTVHNVRLRLINERTAFFTLAGQRFVRLSSGLAAGTPAGFYQLLLAGRAQVLARRSKKPTEEIVQQHLSFVYKETSRLFIKKESELIEIANLKSLLAALANHKPELQKFARSNGLKFNTAARELSVVKLVSYYNSL